VTYTLNGHLYQKPTGPDGAYLIVGPPTSRTCQTRHIRGRQPQTGCGTGESIGTGISTDVIVAVTYQNGRTCRTSAPVQNTAGPLCPPVGYVPPAGIPHVRPGQVAAPITVQPLRRIRYCVARRPGKPTFRRPCAGPIPPGYTLGAHDPANDEIVVSIAWTARVAAKSPNSIYDVLIRYPCNQGGEGTGRPNRSVTAGERIIIRTQVPVSHCAGLYTAAVGYLPNVGPSGSEQGGLPAPGTGGTLLVGRTSFRVPN
jgi:hypothetical protein